MRKKTVYDFGIIYIILLILTYNVIFSRFYWYSWEYDINNKEIGDFLLFYYDFQIYYNTFSLVIIIITIIFIFSLKITIANILGVLGTILYIIGTLLMFYVHLNLAPYRFPIYYLPLVFIVLVSYFLIHSFLILLNLKTNVDEELKIKKTILDIGTKFTESQVQEISEKCNSDKNTIVRIIKKMIENKEIYAEYFKSSKTVAFYQQQNINELDTLMAKYNEWEEKNVDKKE